MTRRSHAKKKRAGGMARHAGGGLEKTEAAGMQGSESTPPMSRRRRWVFRLTAGVGIPCLAVLAVETTLRLFGFGVTTAFLIPCNTAKGQALCTNLKATWAYFPPEAARQPISFTVVPEKAKDTYRIFVLGASAAQGDPQPAFSFGRILEVLLEDRFPKTDFEVINAAITAINSHVVRDIARDCAEWAPDLFVVYLGHNEVVGPLGPSSVFVPLPGSVRLRRAAIGLSQLRIAQLARRLAGADSPAEWGGMEMFLDHQIAWDDPRLSQVYDNFRDNLIDICETATGRGAGAALCTVASNLKDCPPFASRHKPGLTSAALQGWQSAYALGQAAEKAGNVEEAVRHFERALAIDDQHAELVYRLGKCRLALSQPDSAAVFLQQARDLDALRFRGDSRINGVIRDVADSLASDGAVLIDAVVELARTSADGIPGRDEFFEHVHPTFHGNYLLACAVLDGVAPHVAAALGATMNDSHNRLSEDQCADQLAYTVWDRRMALEDMSSRLMVPPFTHQAGHEARMASYRAGVAALRDETRAGNLQSAVEVYERALATRPEDPFLHFNYAMMLARGLSDFAKAESLLRRAVDTVPHDLHTWSVLADVVSEQGRHAEAAALCRRASVVDPLDYTVHSRLGRFLALQGQLPAAIEAQKRAIELKPGFTTAHVRLLNALRSLRRVQDAIPFYAGLIKDRPNNAALRIHLAQALAETGQVDRADVELRQAIRLDGDNADAHMALGRLWVGRDRGAAESHFVKAMTLAPDRYEPHAELGDLLMKSGKGVEAAVQYEEVIRIKPDLGAAYYMLGYLAEQADRTDEAVRLYEKTVTIEPNLPDAHDRLAGLYDRQNRLDAASAQYRELLTLRPSDPFAHHKLAIVLSRIGQLDEAIAELRTVLQLKPDHFETHYNLGSLLFLQDRPEAALSAWSEAARLKPDHAEVQHKMAVALFRLERTDEAIESGRRAVGMDPRNVEARRSLARFLTARGRTEEAAAQLDAALELDPTDEATKTQRRQPGANSD